MTTMGERIKYLRGIKGITQEILANEIKCDRSSLSKWENGLTFPPAWTTPQVGVSIGGLIYAKQKT